MPTVGSKTFSYTDKGEKAARMYAAKTGQKMTVDQSKEKSSGVKTSGEYKGKSNKLGYGGRAQQLKDKGVPGGVIGNLARAAGAAPGQPNYHGGKRGK